MMFCCSDALFVIVGRSDVGVSERNSRCLGDAAISKQALFRKQLSRQFGRFLWNEIFFIERATAFIESMRLDF